ncbi:lysophospholipid acyltransferase family protein [Orenia marismortui]|uniref:lysophospholipid acyltransferase family protein n=1 Tax=Orenia marismortui TaxID=46469 RepID=UPI00036B6BA3|nr:lysophospholipid acyltransferase family protein [Orenia marismortui]
MIESINYYIFKLFQGIIVSLPRRISYLIAKFIGFLLFYLIKSRRKLAIKNLKLSLGYSDKEAKKITKKVFQDVAIKFIEALYLKEWSDSDFEDKIKVEGLKYFERAYKENRGVILFTGHIGNWDLMGIYLASLGYPVNGVARMYKNSKINQEILDIRRSKGGKVFNKKGKGIRKAFKSLLKKEVLVILGDQDAHNKGEFVQFLNRPASTPTGPVLFAQKTGALIVPAYMIREKYNYRLVIEKPIEVSKDADKEEVKSKLQELTLSLENQVKQNPEQWLWLHRRWKTNIKEALG